MFVGVSTRQLVGNPPLMEAGRAIELNSQSDGNSGRMYSVYRKHQNMGVAKRAGRVSQPSQLYRRQRHDPLGQKQRSTIRLPEAVRYWGPQSFWFHIYTVLSFITIATVLIFIHVSYDLIGIFSYRNKSWWVASVFRSLKSLKLSHTGGVYWVYLVSSG